MIIKPNKLEILCNWFKDKILAIKKAKKCLKIEKKKKKR